MQTGAQIINQRIILNSFPCFNFLFSAGLCLLIAMLLARNAQGHSPGAVASPYRLLPFQKQCCGWTDPWDFYNCKIPFPGGSDGKESACNAGDLSLIPWLIPGLGRFPEKGNGYPLKYSCLENSMNRQATVHRNKSNQGGKRPVLRKL